MINRKKLIEGLSKDYEAELKEMTGFVLDRSEIDLGSKEYTTEKVRKTNATELLLGFNPEGDYENTAREAGYLQAMRSMISTVRNFNSLGEK